VFRWLGRIVVGFRGFFLWVRTERALFVLWLVILVAAFIRGVGLLNIFVIVILGVCLMMAEMFNSAIELLCDRVTPGFSQEIKTIKDICAAAVLVAGLALVVVGAWIIIA